MNSTQLLLLGLLVWFAMSNKSKDTRNVILVVTGILFFCMMNVKEGFDLSLTGGVGGLKSVFTGGTEGAGAGAQSTYTVGEVVFEGVGPWDMTTQGSRNNISCANPQKILNQPAGASAREKPADGGGNISDFFTCEECPEGQTVTDGVCAAASQGCPAGQHSPNGACTPCTDNKIKADAGTGSCTDCPPGTIASGDATHCTAAASCRFDLTTLPENTRLDPTTCGGLTQTAGEMWSQEDECEVVCKEDFTRSSPSPNENAPTVHLRCDSDGKLGLKKELPAGAIDALATDVKCCGDTLEEPDGEGGCANSTLVVVGGIAAPLLLGVAIVGIIAAR